MTEFRLIKYSKSTTWLVGEYLDATPSWQTWTAGSVILLWVQQL